MSEFCFLVGRGEVPAKTVKKIRAIEKECRVDFHNPKLPGQGYRYWFSGPNRGNPFDRALADEVREALERAGITLP